MTDDLDEEDDDGGLFFQDASKDKDMEEVLELPQTSDLKVMAIINPEIDDRRLCIIVYSKDDDGIETASARIDFDDPDEVEKFAKSLIAASKQIFIPDQVRTVLN